ncbi:Serine/threonine-protein kinase/endoribonuclease ire-1 [Ceratocystis fimbriata CBS 114723]|uniref:non-specific serine/threonine protein kinase n=1 Tax=Ceratocystis fimbriata CBS 114723 TaxID=1035309 RepID=A0A2C5WWB1_9PEZI|nr:Serine/threonine-protein kinase/endoribonuclease ire-1 [Ceratocystis fimbriata CBS 114723]
MDYKHEYAFRLIATTEQAAEAIERGKRDSGAFSECPEEAVSISNDRDTANTAQFSVPSYRFKTYRDNFVAFKFGINSFAQPVLSPRCSPCGKQLVVVSYSMVTAQVFIEDYTDTLDAIVFTSETHQPLKQKGKLYLAPTMDHKFYVKGTECAFSLVWNDNWLEAVRRHLKRIPADLLIPPRESSIYKKKTSKFRYVELETIGTGATSQVIKALDVDSGQVVAIKQTETSRNSHLRKMLLEEALMLKQLCHPSIVEFIRVDELENGVDLALACKPLSMQQAIELKLFKDNLNAHSDLFMHQMLEALAYLSSLFIVHLDIKPANILCAPARQRNVWNFFLADFGLAMPTGNPLCSAGTPGFAAPELSSSPACTSCHPSMDTYSLYLTLLVLRHATAATHAFIYTNSYQPPLTSPEEDPYLIPYACMRNPVPETRPLASSLLDENFPECNRICFATTNHHKPKASISQPSGTRLSPSPLGKRIKLHDGDVDGSKERLRSISHDIALFQDIDHSNSPKNEEFKRIGTPSQVQKSREEEMCQWLHNLHLCNQIKIQGQKKRKPNNDDTASEGDAWLY